MMLCQNSEELLSAGVSDPLQEGVNNSKVSVAVRGITQAAHLMLLRKVTTAQKKRHGIVKQPLLAVIAFSQNARRQSQGDIYFLFLFLVVNCIPGSLFRRQNKFSVTFHISRGLMVESRTHN